MSPACSISEGEDALSVADMPVQSVPCPCLMRIAWRGFVCIKAELQLGDLMPYGLPQVRIDRPEREPRREAKLLAEKDAELRAKEEQVRGDESGVTCYGWLPSTAEVGGQAGRETEHGNMLRPGQLPCLLI